MIILIKGATVGPPRYPNFTIFSLLYQIKPVPDNVIAVYIMTDNYESKFMTHKSLKLYSETLYFVKK